MKSNLTPTPREREFVADLARKTLPGATNREKGLRYLYLLAIGRGAETNQEIVNLLAVKYSNNHTIQSLIGMRWIKETEKNRGEHQRSRGYILTKVGQESYECLEHQLTRFSGAVC